MMMRHKVMEVRLNQGNDMKMWEIREGYDPEYMGSGMSYRHGMGGDGEYEQGFEEGCEHGYRKAMKEMRSMGMRDNQPTSGNYGRGNMGNSRFMPPYPPYMNYRDDDDDDDMMQQRRRRDYRGRYM